jgi:hypothetical protein
LKAILSWSNCNPFLAKGPCASLGNALSYDSPSSFRSLLLETTCAVHVFEVVGNWRTFYHRSLMFSSPNHLDSWSVTDLPWPSLHGMLADARLHSL